MGRKITDELNAFVNELKVEPMDDENIIKQIRKYKLITPLFGGGAVTKKADEVKIIRETEIRGQLRFWWRAIRGGRFSSIPEMKKVEDSIFGSTEIPSTVKIEIQIENKGSKFNLPRELGYASFPLRDSDAFVLNGISFSLVISFPIKFKDDLAATFWIWETFGGIGARTRRGFGALQLTELKENDKVTTFELTDSEQKIREKAKKIIVDGNAPNGMPYLKKDLRLLVIEKPISVIEVWKKLIDNYKNFRQQRKIEQEYSENYRRMEDRPKRSKWNEPETIRDLLRQRLNKRDRETKEIIKQHQPIEPNFEKFPRAAFGLPIVFKFKDSFKSENPRDRGFDRNYLDPRKTILNPTGYERFSSPLILRPIACQNNKAIGIALILENEISLDEIGLTLETQEGSDWSRAGLQSAFDNENQAKEIKVAETNKETIRKLGTNNLLQDETDVIQAFLNYLEKMEK